jgi:hypothetical protein
MDNQTLLQQLTSIDINILGRMNLFLNKKGVLQYGTPKNFRTLSENEAQGVKTAILTYKCLPPGIITGDYSPWQIFCISAVAGIKGIPQITIPRQQSIKTIQHQYEQLTLNRLRQDSLDQLCWHANHQMKVADNLGRLTFAALEKSEPKQILCLSTYSLKSAFERAYITDYVKPICTKLTQLGHI